MKVYELMNELAELPSGAEVKACGWFSDDEINKSVYDTDTEDDGRTVIKGLQFKVDNCFEECSKDVTISLSKMNE